MSDDVLRTLEKMDDKLDTMDARQDQMDKTLIRQELNLQEHMRRSDLLETMLSDMEDDMVPVQKHVYHVEGAMKLLGAVATGVAIIGGILKILNVI